MFLRNEANGVLMFLAVGETLTSLSHGFVSVKSKKMRLMKVLSNVNQNHARGFLTT